MTRESNFNLLKLKVLIFLSRTILYIYLEQKTDIPLAHGIKFDL